MGYRLRPSSNDLSLAPPSQRQGNPASRMRKSQLEFQVPVETGNPKSPPALNKRPRPSRARLDFGVATDGCASLASEKPVHVCLSSDSIQSAIRGWLGNEMRWRADS